MPYLTLLYGKKVIGQYSVDHGFPISIGRKDNNNIVINNLAVSGIHARVEFNNDGIFVIDMDSKNGTFINGKPSIKSLLKEGDEIVIGKHKLIFSEAENAKIMTTSHAVPTISAANNALDETMVLDTNKHRDMISSVLSGATGQPGKKKAPTPVLMIQAGGSGKVTLNNKFTRIGKDSRNDIITSGFLTGKRAATVTKQENGYYISHVKGLTKTTVNGQKVKQAYKLVHGDIISIGRLKMRFLSKAKTSGKKQT